MHSNAGPKAVSIQWQVAKGRSSRTYGHTIGGIIYGVPGLVVGTMVSNGIWEN